MFTLTVVSLLVAGALGFPSYHGPEAKPVVLASGHLADTHEVAAAKSLHLGALSQASTHSGAGDSNYHDVHDDGHHSYSGPHAVPKVLPDGHIADTHEVSAAKQAHLAALAEAKAHNPGGDSHEGSEYHGAAAEHSHQSYHGPLANPVVLPSGHLADTHDVAAAKGAHLEALAAQRHGH